MSQSLAVLMRPRRFADVVGQPHLTSTLKAAANAERVPQQILISGPSGVGKTTLARVFAATLFCVNKDETGDACGECVQCVQVTGPGNSHVDIRELDAASYGGVEKIREISNSVHLMPLEAKYKIYIIDEAHGLTASGSQAFLRTLEEPPEHAIFILATTDPDKLPVALEGRCLICPAWPSNEEVIVQNLKRVLHQLNKPYEETALTLLAKHANLLLGTRGSVVLLEKVLAHDPENVDVAAVSAALYLGDVKDYDSLTQAIVTRDEQVALRSVYALLQTVAEGDLREWLTRWAATELKNAVAQQKPLHHWLRINELLLTSKFSLPLLVVNLVSPWLEPQKTASADIEKLSGLLKEANDTIVVLTKLLDKPSTEPAADGDVKQIGEKTSRKKTTAAKTSTTTAGFVDTLTSEEKQALWVALLNAVSSKDPMSALNLRQSKHHWENNTLVVTNILSNTKIDVVKTSAQDVGLNIQL